MKFEHQYDKGDPKITVELHRDADIHQAVEAFRQFLAACGYTESSINEVLGEPS